MSLRKRIEKLHWRDSAEDKAVYRVMDLQIIKFNGIINGAITEGDEISKIIDRLTHHFLWIYMRGLSMEPTVNGVLAALNDADQELYKQAMDDFVEFNKFMRTNMELKVGI